MSTACFQAPAWQWQATQQTVVTMPGTRIVRATEGSNKDALPLFLVQPRTGKNTVKLKLHLRRICMQASA